MKKILKKGDRIYLEKRRPAGSPLLNGSTFEIIDGDTSCRTFKATLLKSAGGFVKGKSFTFYAESDIYRGLTKDDTLDYLKKKKLRILEELSKVDAEIDFNEKYDSMEEFVADKIGLLIQADTKEARVAILTTLKQTNLL